MLLAAIQTGAASAVDAAALNLRDTLVDIATQVLPLAVAVIAIMLGFQLAMNFFSTDAVEGDYYYEDGYYGDAKDHWERSALDDLYADEFGDDDGW